MLNLVNEIKAGLDCQYDYVLNNSDFSTSYDHIVIDQLVYNNTPNYEVLNMLLQHFDIEHDASLLSEYWDRFLSNLDYGNFEVKLSSCGYENMIGKNCFLQISIGEQEFHTYDNWDKLTFKNGIAEHINKTTDFCINDSGHAYIDMTCYCLLYTCERDFLNDIVIDVNKGIK